MKVFLTGGTGFVGQAITECLLAEGHSIRMLVRRKKPGSPGIEEFRGNLLDESSLGPALDGTEAVIHLVGIISEIGENTFETVHTRGTQNVIAAAGSAGVKRFVHMSALGTRPDAVSRYHKSKWAAEEAVRKSGLDYTIFRPSLIFGPRDQFVNLFAKIIQFSPVVPILADERAHFQPVAIENVAKAFALCLKEPRAISQSYDLCGPEVLTLREIVHEICQAMGRKRLKLRVPLVLSRWQAGFMEFFFPTVLKKAAPLNRDQLIMLHEDTRGDPEPANELFHLKPIRLREGLGHYLGSKHRFRKP
jgi:uncharacterized protein YbjT (DUF2867 family)